MKSLLITLLALFCFIGCGHTVDWKNVDMSPAQDMLNYQQGQQKLQQQQYRQQSSQPKQLDRQCMKNCLDMLYTRALCESRCGY